ncbi:MULTISPECIES: NAD-dependent epimerase/dehydratase family protein [unclassified Rhodococcus (in: high G+C Gram-positive bacteria)]|uniref:NAD-dependent epimerase/dehydratase family protein n=1 Tax=unclassified Rhodococcus (in: high G+C Gram-positive bacteria) TaxID=192944 RepID=UPI000B9BEF26|nr:MULTISPECIES: NAD-dependent epimerase/dehydratase family protein [unclassified Rhodococcus (in: high G+C Gram-positive bacteria)]OZE34538.1 reductase [Rhodococcus sp. 05-2254-4]OZE46266.1 reductase [Rhodococcus sp. 05-2254-3]OZE50769.1 reductase [Rhodococcus sp. 05-2254-2]
MKLLVLGGSDFVGRTAVEHALDLQWDVTVLNRGTTASDPRVTQLRGDRRSPDGLNEIREGNWDIVFDTWSWEPDVVAQSAALLAGRVGGYVYVSSRSVYDAPQAGATEAWPTVQGSGEDYARCKLGGEQAVVAGFGTDALLVRAGLILGPYENIGRLPWWLNRIEPAGDVLAPGPVDLALQYIDARDLVAWSLDAAARGLGGAFDVVSRPGHATIGELLQCCIAATRSDARLCWVEPDVLRTAGVQPWTELPIWIPPGADHDSLHASDVSKAFAARLRTRPIQETVADTWTWLQSLKGRSPMRSERPPVGLSADREAAILAARGLT